MITFNYYNPTRIVFGSGKLNTLAEQELPGKKALLLISNGKSTKVNGSLGRVKEQLAEAGVEYAVFDKIMENPIKEVVMEGAAFSRRERVRFYSRTRWRRRARFLQGDRGDGDQCRRFVELCERRHRQGQTARKKRASHCNDPHIVRHRLGG